jgi:hypothetical protein
MAALGAFRGWREGAVREEPQTQVRRRTVAYAVAAVVLALVGYVVIHGFPVG